MKVKLSSKTPALSKTEPSAKEAKRLAEQEFLSEVVEAIEARRKALKPEIYRKPKVKVG
jgi:hypothetical protein